MTSIGSKIEIKPESPDLNVAAADLPPGHVKVDPYFGNQEIYRQQVDRHCGFYPPRCGR